MDVITVKSFVLNYILRVNYNEFIFILNCIRIALTFQTLAEKKLQANSCTFIP